MNELRGEAGGIRNMEDVGAASRVSITAPEAVPGEDCLHPADEGHPEAGSASRQDFLVSWRNPQREMAGVHRCH